MLVKQILDGKAKLDSARVLKQFEDLPAQANIQRSSSGEVGQEETIPEGKLQHYSKARKGLNTATLIPKITGDRNTIPTVSSSKQFWK